MKTKTFFASLLFGALAMPSLAEEISDTLIVKRPEKVTIITQDTLQRITVKGSKQNADYRYVQTISYADTSVVKRKTFGLKELVCGVKKCEGKKGTVTTDGYLNIGLNTMLDAESGSYNLWPSFDVAIGMTADWHPFGAKNVWSLGLGFDWRNYRMSTHDGYWAQDAAGMMGLTPSFPVGSSDKVVGLHVTSLQVPVLYTHYFDSKQKYFVTIGGLVNFNFWAHANRQYEVGDEDFDINTKSIGQRSVTVDAYMQFRAPYLPKLYCKYCPMTFFKKDRGPKMHQFTIGIGF